MKRLTAIMGGCRVLFTSFLKLLPFLDCRVDCRVQININCAIIDWNSSEGLCFAIASAGSMWGGGGEGGQNGAPMIPFHRPGARYQQGQPIDAINQQGQMMSTMSVRPEDFDRMALLGALHQSGVPHQAVQVPFGDPRQRRDMPGNLALPSSWDFFPLSVH